MKMAKFDCTFLETLHASMCYSVGRVTSSPHHSVAVEIYVMVSAEHREFQVDCE